MNKSQIIEAISLKLDIPKNATETMLNAFFDTITEALKAGEKVCIQGFGTFELRDRGPRIGKNPRTGETIQIQASRTPTLRVSKTYKKVFN